METRIERALNMLMIFRNLSMKNETFIMRIFFFFFLREERREKRSPFYRDVERFRHPFNIIYV